MKILAAILLLTGCAPITLPTPELPPMVWRSDLREGAALWETKAVERFGQNVYLFACHGADLDDGTWQCVTEEGGKYSVQTIARFLSDAMPTRTIVLLCCNCNHREISVPRGNVYYSRRNLTMNPGGFNPFCDNSIWQFKP